MEMKIFVNPVILDVRYVSDLCGVNVWNVIMAIYSLAPLVKKNVQMGYLVIYGMDNVSRIVLPTFML